MDSAYSRLGLEFTIISFSGSHWIQLFCCVKYALNLVKLSRSTVNLSSLECGLGCGRSVNLLFRNYYWLAQLTGYCSLQLIPHRSKGQLDTQAIKDTCTPLPP